MSNRLTRSRSRLAFLPERFNPPFYLTGKDFLRYMLQLQEVVYRDVDAERMFLALDLDLSALAKPVRAFSKGMTQKLGLAACLLSGKDLYILDEPTSGLDPKARALLKEQLRATRNEGKTIFFTSHALADVDELCDQMAVIHRGELRFAGTPDELRNCTRRRVWSRLFSPASRTVRRPRRRSSLLGAHRAIWQNVLLPSVSRDHTTWTLPPRSSPTFSSSTTIR